MKYLVGVYSERTTLAFECHVIANDEGAAMEMVKEHLLLEGKPELAYELKTAIDIGDTNEKGMLLLPLEASPTGG